MHTQDFKMKYAHNYLLNVEGMNCIKCIDKLRSVGLQIDAEKMDFDMSRRQVLVRSNKILEPKILIEKIKSLGFNARLIEEDNSDQTNETQNIFLRRIAIAGACTGNIMILSFANYFGASDTIYGDYFEWVMMLLFLPVLLYSAQPILSSSFYALKARRSSIDLPLAIALIFGFILSFRNILLKNHNTYFDSLSMFVFLLLSTRYFLFKIQNRYLKPIDVAQLFSAEKIEKLFEGQYIFIRPDEIKAGDVIKFKKNFRPNFDGRLLSEGAEFDNSLITGEVLPVLLRREEKVYSGTRLVSAEALVEVTHTGVDCRASQIIEKTNEALMKKTPLISVTDKFAQRFSLSVVIVSVLVFFYLDLKADEVFNRVLALLVLACPCALAVATPLAISLSARRALKFNVLIKKPEIFEKLIRVKNVVFDKTGTITKGEYSVVKIQPIQISDEHKKIILALEKNSEHPVAVAIKNYFEIDRDIINLDNYVEIPGTGVSGYYKGKKYELRAGKKDKELSCSSTFVGFYEDEVLVYNFELQDQVQPTALSTIDWFRKNRFNLFMISGDLVETTKQIASGLGFLLQNVFGGFDPEQKSKKVSEIESDGGVLYVGDGANDCLAMANSSVCLSTHKSVDVSFKTADAHILSEGIGSIINLIKLSDRLMKTIKVNLAISIFYNSIFAFLALSGKINPYVAAVLMPISSLTLILHTFFSIEYVVREKTL